MRLFLEKKKLKLIVINSEIHVKEKARQAKQNAIANCFEKGKNRQFLKGHCHQFLMICKSKEKNDFWKVILFYTVGTTTT